MAVRIHWVDVRNVLSTATRTYNHAIKSTYCWFSFWQLFYYFSFRKLRELHRLERGKTVCFESRVTSAGEQPLENYNVYLIGLKPHGQRSLVGYSPGGGKRSDTTVRQNSKAQRSGIFPFEFTSRLHLWLTRGPDTSAFPCWAFPRNTGSFENLLSRCVWEHLVLITGLLFVCQSKAFSEHLLWARRWARHWKSARWSHLHGAFRCIEMDDGHVDKSVCNEHQEEESKTEGK